MTKTLDNIEAMRLTLEFYAKEANWRNNDFSPAVDDGGEKARTALTDLEAAIEEESNNEANRRVKVFFEALADCDVHLRRRILAHIRELARNLIAVQDLAANDAINIAAEFFAALIWRKVQVPERSPR